MKVVVVVLGLKEAAGVSLLVYVLKKYNYKVLNQIIHRCFQHQVGAVEEEVQASRASVQVPFSLTYFMLF